MQSRAQKPYISTFLIETCRFLIFGDVIFCPGSVLLQLILVLQLPLFFDDDDFFSSVSFVSLSWYLLSFARSVWVCWEIRLFFLGLILFFLSVMSFFMSCCLYMGVTRFR